MSKPHYIREWRKFRGLTMDHLAAQLGLSKAVISRIESGAQRYNQEIIEQIAAALRCSAGDLIMTDPTAPADFLADIEPAGREILRKVAEGLRYGRPKTLPHDGEAEERLVAALLYDMGGFIDVNRLWGMLPDEAFYFELHRHLYTVIAHRAERGAPTDPAAIAGALSDYEPLQAAGGISYLAGLVETAPNAGQVPALAGRIFELWVQRELARKQ